MHFLKIFISIFLIGFVFSGITFAKEVRFGISVSSLCIAKGVQVSSILLEVHMFCNSARGGSVSVISSLSGDPLRIATGDGNSFVLRAGQQRQIFESTGPFKQKIRLELPQGNAAEASQRLLFQANPNA